jgi:hypothetical protein
VDGHLNIECRARRLDRLVDEVKSTLATSGGLREAAIDVQLDLSDDPLLQDVVKDFQSYQAALADAQLEYNEALRRAVRRLGAERLSDRDVSFLLGLSHQRIAQVRSA